MRDRDRRQDGGTHGAGKGTRPDAPGPGKRTLIDATFGAPANPGLQLQTLQPHVVPSAAGVHAAAARGIAGPATALPHGDAIQQAFGRHDVSGIKAHVGGPAQAANKAIGAEAYATGNHVAFAGAPSLHRRRTKRRTSSSSAVGCS